MSTHRTADALFSLHAHGPESCTLSANPYTTENNRLLSPEPTLPMSISPSENFVPVHSPHHRVDDKFPEQTSTVADALLCATADHVSIPNIQTLNAHSILTPASHSTQSSTTSRPINLPQCSSRNLQTSFSEGDLPISPQPDPICQGDSKKKRDVDQVGKHITDSKHRDNNAPDALPASVSNPPNTSKGDQESKRETPVERKRRLARERQRKRRRRLRDGCSEKAVESFSKVENTIIDDATQLDPISKEEDLYLTRVDTSPDRSFACEVPELTSTGLTEGSTALTGSITHAPVRSPNRNSSQAGGSDFNTMCHSRNDHIDRSLKEPQNLESNSKISAKEANNTDDVNVGAVTSMATNSSRESNGKNDFTTSFEDPQQRKRRLARDRQRRRRLLLRQLKEGNQGKGDTSPAEKLPSKPTDGKPQLNDQLIENTGMSGDLNDSAGSVEYDLLKIFDNRRKRDVAGVNEDVADASKSTNMVRQCLNIGCKPRISDESQGHIHWSSAFDTADSAQKAVNQVLCSLQRHLGGVSDNARAYLVQQILQLLSQNEDVIDGLEQEV